MNYTPCCVINTEPEYITKISLDAQDMCLFNIAYCYEFGYILTNVMLIECERMAKISIVWTFSSHEKAFDYFISQNHYVLLLSTKAYENDLRSKHSYILIYEILYYS